MDSQRERGKSQRKLKILQAASDEFKRNGFEKTRVEEIAKLAGVAPGTVYNYFPTKDLLLLELVMLHRDSPPAGLLRLLSSPPSDPVRAFVAFYEIMVAESMRYLDKPLWRHAIAAFTVGSWNEAAEKRWRHEQDLIDYQTSLLKLLQHDRVIPASIDAAEVVEIIHASSFFWWQQFLSRDDFSFDDLIRKLEHLFTFLLGTLMKHQVG